MTDSQTTSALDGENRPANAVLSARDIRKSFKAPDGASIEILKGVSLSLNAGESLSLRGESGAGKTTLMNILSGFESPTSGEVFWGETRVDNLSNSAQARLRAGFTGFVFQHYCLMPELTAQENVELSSRIFGDFGKNARKRARELLCMVGLENRLSYLPSKLSGGERQRVAIARAVMNAPKVLLADEPTGNLDEDTAAGVMQTLLNLCRDTSAALMLITHNVEFAKATDREVFLSQGEISAIR